MNFELPRHPLSFVIDLCRKFSEIRKLEFGIYRYVPQTVKDFRRIVYLPASGLEERFFSLRDSLGPQEEIAFHSKVYVGRLFRECVLHVPMIDFKGDMGDRQIDLGLGLLNDFRCSRAAIFSSGRSYHLYAFALLSEKEWIGFMGRALLLNPPDGPDLVDTRWIGHRLLAGYSSLRWTKNTDFYLQLPELVRDASLASVSLEKVTARWSGIGRNVWSRSSLKANITSRFAHGFQRFFHSAPPQ